MRMLQAPLLVRTRPLAGGYKPPKLGGWGSEQPNSMYNTDKALAVFILHVIRPVLLQREGSNGVHGLLPQYVLLFRPPTP